MGLIALMMLGRDRRVMGDGTIGGRLYTAGRIVTLAILSVRFLVRRLGG